MGIYEKKLRQRFNKKRQEQAKKLGITVDRLEMLLARFPRFANALRDDFDTLVKAQQIVYDDLKTKMETAQDAQIIPDIATGGVCPSEPNGGQIENPAS